MAEEWIRIGVVQSVNVPSRTLRIAAKATYAAALKRAEWIRLVLSDSRMLRCRVAHVRLTSEHVLVELGPGVTRDSVAAMRNAAVVVLSEELAEEDADRVAPVQLIGFDVVDDSGAVVGSIEDAYAAAANDVVEIRTHDGRRASVPVVDAFVDTIDTERRRIVFHDLTPFYDDAD